MLKVELKRITRNQWRDLMENITSDDKEVVRAAEDELIGILVGIEPKEVGNLPLDDYLRVSKELVALIQGEEFQKGA